MDRRDCEFYSIYSSFNFCSLFKKSKILHLFSSHVNKKLAEQAAALVALHGLNIRSMLAGDWEST